MTFLTAAIALLSLVVSSVAQANDIRAAAPALETYAQDRLFGEVGKRPGLSPRDRSMVTLAVLIARRQTVEMPYYVNLALDHGVTPAEISEIITHLAFYAGWANAMSAVAATKEVFAQRNGSAATNFPRLADAPAAERGCRGTNARRGSDSSSALCPRESCSTPPTSCSAISGCARTSRPGIGVSSPSAP